MARSTGGGSRSGGSRSSSSRSSGGGSRSSRSSSGRSSGSGSRSSIFYSAPADYPKTKSRPFKGARKFQYKRGNKIHYVYSTRNLTNMRDAKPRWLALIYLIPFIFITVFLWHNSIIEPIQKYGGYSTFYMDIVDSAEILSDEDEKQLADKQREMGSVTGITTVILTVNEYDWTSTHQTLADFAMDQYYEAFPHEAGWLLVYSVPSEDSGEWRWESVDGDYIIPITDLYFDQFSNVLHGNLVVNEGLNPTNAFLKAFDKCVEVFNAQEPTVNVRTRNFAYGFIVFDVLAGYLLVFAGLKPYSFKELEEVTDKKEQDPEAFIDPGYLECEYCGTKRKKMFKFDLKCYHCGAINKIRKE